MRARDVPFMVEHRQPICKLAFEQMLEPPDKLYGADVHSNYQGQETMLSKHFVEQTAGSAQLALRGDRRDDRGPSAVVAIAVGARARVTLYG